MARVTKTTKSRSVAETCRFAAALGRSAKTGSIIELIGGLGSGKTVFARAFAHAFGVRGRIVSPTFVLTSRYHVSTKKALYHVDCYRLGRLSKNDAGFLTELLNEKSAVVLVEWADRITALLKCISRSRRTTITFIVTGARTRTLVIQGALSRAAPMR